MPKVWISKYALTKPVFEIEVYFDEPEDFAIHNEDDCISVTIFDKGEYHSTREEAINKANAMRNAEIEKLQKLIDH